MAKIKVLIVDDSLVFGKFLTENLPRVNPSIEIVGYASNPYDANLKIPKLNPDVISLDVEMPGMNGIEFLKKLLPRKPIPVVLVSSLNVGVFDALAFGAVDFVKKPDMSRENSTGVFVKNLATKLVIASCARVRVPDFNREVIPKNQDVADVLNSGKKNRQKEPVKANYAPVTENRNKGIAVPVVKPLSGYSYKGTPESNLKLNSTIIAIGASTGGTEATLEILKNLPGDTPGTVITQHMPKGFTKMYAERLNKLCQMEVKEAEDGDEIRRGLALIAPGDLQMKVVKRNGKYFVSCRYDEKVSGHRPSVDVLFNSIAENVNGMKTVGVILTGMGQDGARGLLNMKKRGAYTIGQDKNTSVVYGMPMVAYNIGAVTKQASIGNICNIIVQHLNSL